jgi:hypothetical protein
MSGTRNPKHFNFSTKSRAALPIFYQVFHSVSLLCAQIYNAKSHSGDIIALLGQDTVDWSGRYYLTGVDLSASVLTSIPLVIGQDYEAVRGTALAKKVSAGE